MDYLLYSVSIFAWIISDVAALVQAPQNLQVIVRGTTATLYWMSDQKGVLNFEITYEVLDSPFGTFRLTHGISRLKRSFVLRGLFPLHTYSIYMVTVAENGVSNKSEIIEFTTNLTDSFESIERRSRGIQLDEAIIVFIVVCLWISAMVLFIKQWGNIRILQPQEPRFKHSPKNLDTITIVKRPQDSVIYKNYSRKMSVTMVEREKKLLRMNTVPIMENVSSLHNLNTLSKLPTIEMEELSIEGGTNA